MKEILQQYWYIVFLLILLLIVGTVLFIAFRKSEIVKKYGIIFYVVYGSLLIFFFIKLLAKAAKNQTPVLGTDISLAIQQLKKMILDNKVLREKAAQKIGEEIKIKSDLEAHIESFFSKYLNH